MIKVLRIDERAEKEITFVSIRLDTIADDRWYQWVFHSDKRVVEYPFGRVSQ